MNIRPVTTLDLPELEPYRTLREATRHWKDGFFVAEGEKVVRRLLTCDLDIISLLMTREWMDIFEKELRARLEPVTPVHVAPGEMLREIVGFQLHKNIMAIARVPPPIPVDELERCGADAVHVAIEGLADAENVGMIARNCAALGAASLIAGDDSCSPYLRRAVRVSVGNVFSLRVRHGGNIIETLRSLREQHGWHIVGTVPRGGSALPSSDGRPLCLVFGNEGEGLSDALLSECTSLHSIPMREGIDSLNVANACAVVLYEATRIGFPS